MKLVITGANGMLGSSLCRNYHKKHEVYALHRDKECLVSCTNSYRFDLLKVQKVNSVVNKINPDLMIHCAGLIDMDKCEKEPEKAFDFNVAFTDDIVRSCTEKTKFIYISTDQVYGKANGHLEDNKRLKPVNEYGKSKLLGEKIVQELHQNHIIIRTNIFGWNVKKNKFSSAEWIYNSLKNGKAITLFTDYTFSPIYTKYLGDIIMELIKIDFKGIINVGSSTPCSKYDFGMAIAQTFGFDQSLISKGSMKQHLFYAKRPSKLDLDCRQLSGIKVKIPTWMQSILMFTRESKKNGLHNKLKRT
jgi:dTDP-4-dehydrorhamnose reductase